jgi:hypothetical protein
VEGAPEQHRRLDAGLIRANGVMSCGMLPQCDGRHLAMPARSAACGRMRRTRNRMSGTQMPKPAAPPDADVAQRLVGWLVHHLNVDASANVAAPDDAVHGNLEVGAGAGL